MRRAIAVVVVLLASSSLAACDWTHVLSDPGRTGAEIGETAIGSSNVALMKTRWVEPGRSAPLVAGGVVYTEGPVGPEDANALQAYDATTGAGVWLHPDAATVAPDAVVDGRIYAGGSSFDVTTGASLGSIFDGDANYGLAVADGQLIGNFGGELDAFDAQTGAHHWTAAANVQSPPTIADGLVFGASVGDGHLHAYDTNTGHEVWSTSGTDHYGLQVAATDGRVYVTTTDAGNTTLRALDDATGAQLWSTPIPAGDVQPAVASGRVFIATTSTLYAFSAATGAPKWNVSVSNRAGSSPISSPSVANGVVYLGSDNGRLYGFNAASGALRFTSPATGAYIVGAAAIANGIVYAHSANDTLWAFALPPAGAHLTASPVFGGGFDPLEITKVSPTTKVSVINDGSATTDAIVTALQGAAASQFRITSNGCSGRHLAAGGSCTLLVAFAPTTSGSKKVTLKIAATNAGSFTMQLSGLALAHPLVVTPPSKDFGNAPGLANFTVSNPAGKPAGPISVTHYWGPSYSLTDNCSGTTLASGGTCTFSVGFSGGAGGRESGLLSVSTPGNAPAIVGLSGG